MIVKMPEEEFLALCQKHLRLYVSLDEETKRVDGERVITDLKIKVRLDFEKENGDVEEVCKDSIATSGYG